MFASLSFINTIIDAVNQLGSLVHGMTGGFGGIL
jgi:hypothetical protein